MVIFTKSRRIKPISPIWITKQTGNVSLRLNVVCFEKKITVYYLVQKPGKYLFSYAEVSRQC